MERCRGNLASLGCVSCSVRRSYQCTPSRRKNTSELSRTSPIPSYHHFDIQVSTQPYTIHTAIPYQPQLMDLPHQEEQRGSSSPEARIVRLKTEPGTSTRQSPGPSSSSNATTAGSSTRPVQPPKVCDKCRLRSESCPHFRIRFHLP